ncbi:hypothetical protein NC652_021275 [Populus alba x Populus x berolinensis]|nr:hypothetical protein NC652_021275 [Populus alba x Populus x berolinensis]
MAPKARVALTLVLDPENNTNTQLLLLFSRAGEASTLKGPVPYLKQLEQFPHNMLPAKAFTRMGLIPASPQAIMLPMYKTTVPVTSEQMIRFDPVVFFKPAWFNLVML